MSEELVRFERPFQVWAYTVSHRQLLLRSPKSAELPTRVDILFKDVRAMTLHPHISTVRLELASDAEAAELSSHLKLTNVRTNIYVIAHEPLMLVAAGIATWHEDAGEYFDQSYFDPLTAPGVGRHGSA
jgi:hypothetical protein